MSSPSSSTLPTKVFLILLPTGDKEVPDEIEKTLSPLLHLPQCYEPTKREERKERGLRSTAHERSLTFRASKQKK